MTRLKTFAFLMVFLVPAQMPLAAWLAARTGWTDAMAWFPLFFLFVMLPSVDFILGHDPVNVPASQESAVARNPWFKTLTLLALPVQLALLAWSGTWFVQAGLTPIGMLGWLLSQGVVGGILGLLLSFAGLALISLQSEAMSTVAKMDWPMLAMTLSLSIGASILAGLLPTWRACQVTPALQLKTQ